MEETLIFLQKLLACTAGLPLNCTAYTKPAVLAFLQAHTSHIFGQSLQDHPAFWQQLLHTPGDADTMYEYMGLGGLTLLMYVDQSHNRAYFFGPVLTQPFSHEDTRRSLAQHGISSSLQTQILQFHSTLPVVSGHILYRTGDLVIRHLTGRKKPLTIAQVDLYSPTEKYLLHDQPETHEDIAQMRQVETRYEHSAALTDAVKQGNLSLALYLIGQYAPGEQNPVRNQNPLRNAQNYCIVLNTQLRHALEESGIHPFLVDKVSNEIGLEIEQIKSTAKISRFFVEIIRKYCRLVQEHAYPNLRPLTNLAVTYIKEHLSDNLTVKDTARALTVNANYLSTLFHKEIGMTFIDFVNRERSIQAAALLNNTRLQIQEIAVAVGYNNTSYFSKQFRRHFGVSPQVYRSGHPT